MHAQLRRIFDFRVVLALAMCVMLTATASNAVQIVYNVVLNGANEAPPNPSLGTGTATVGIDPVTHTMYLHLDFTGLSGTTTACHIHAATAVAGAGTAGVATTTPYFAGFPIGVTSGSYDNLLDMTAASSYNPAYVTAHGGNTTQAEADLFAAIAAGRAYLNVHSSVVPGGEIRGFLLPAAVATEQTTWGNIKALYR